jgi:hypothetical protein
MLAEFNGPVGFRYPTVMLPRAVPTLFCLLLTAAAVAGERGADVARDAAPGEHRYLEPGSWIVTETRVRSNGAAVTEKHKLAVVARPNGDGPAVQESKWAADGFEPAGPARPLDRGNDRNFDGFPLKPDRVQPDGVVTVGPKRYVCRVETYTLRGETPGRSAVLTLWRDKSGGTQLPPRTVAIHGTLIPLPVDALQAEIVIEGPNVSTRSRRVVSALASPLRVNGQTLSCLVETTETRGTEGGKAVELAVREWRCHDVPGEPLRTVTCGKIGGAEVQSETAVVEFYVARTASASSGATAGGAGGMPTILPSAE